MVKVPWFRYQHCLVPLPYCLSKDPLKREFLHIYFTTYFRFCNFRNTFFWKYSKFNQAFKNAKTNCGKFIFFWNNCICFGYLKFSVLRRGYLSSVVNMLTNILKTFHITKRYFVQFNCLHSEQVVWFRLQRCLVPLTMLLVEGHLKQDVLDIYLTTYQGTCNFGNTSAMRVMLFLKYWKLNLDVKNAETNSEIVFFSGIIASELAVWSYLY